MAYYYINTNKQSNGDHEVHAGTCSWLPDSENRVYLGVFNNGVAAVAEAKRRWPKAQINGCYYCSRESHTG